MKAVTLLLSVSLLSLTGCDNEKQVSTSPRYTAQTFTATAGFTGITQITDHQENRIYYYKLEGQEGLVLYSTVDLTKCGDKNISFEAPEKDK